MRFSLSLIWCLALFATALTACGPPPLELPAGWPLPDLRPPPGARPLAVSELKPPNRPYYSSSSDESIQPAIDAQARLVNLWLDSAGEVEGAASATFADRPVLSADGTAGQGWGIAYRLASGWNTSLAQCEEVLHQPQYEIVAYVPGQLRVYRSHDRRTEVALVAGKGDQLLLAISRYSAPLPTERDLADRADARHAARRLAEAVKTAALEINQ